MCSHCSRERFAKVLRKVCASHVGDLATLQEQLLFRLPIAFSRVGKKQIGNLKQFCFFPGREKANWKSEPFAFSRPGKKQNGSLNHFAESLDHFAFFPGPGKSKLEV